MEPSLSHALYGLQWCVDATATIDPIWLERVCCHPVIT
jgi:hypothetical protein